MRHYAVSLDPAIIRKQKADKGCRANEIKREAIHDSNLRRPGFAPDAHSRLTQLLSC